MHFVLQLAIKFSITRGLFFSWRSIFRLYEACFSVGDQISLIVPCFSVRDQIFTYTRPVFQFAIKFSLIRGLFFSLRSNFHLYEACFSVSHQISLIVPCFSVTDQIFTYTRLVFQLTIKFSPIRALFFS
jgi:hypothetical protein